MCCLQFPDTPSAVLSVFDFDPEEIARQMTLIDFSLFARIKPSELLNQVPHPPHTLSTEAHPPSSEGVAEAKVQGPGPEPAATGGAHEQPDSVGGHHHPLSEGQPLPLSTLLPHYNL